jgi:hypothetical protein
MDLERENMLALWMISHMIKALNAMFETEQYLCGAFFAICFKVSFARTKTLRLHASVHPYQAKVRLK